jgi:8-oxo-dGTP diphosphatase
MAAPKLLNNVKFLQKCIVVDNAGKILALRRDPNDVRRPNCWDLPGGNYEEGETIEECIKREVREETSLIAHTLRPIYVASNMGETYQNINVIALAQACDKWEGEVKLSSEHTEFHWVTPEEFMDLETGDDGGFLKQSLQAYLTLPH